MIKFKTILLISVLFLTACGEVPIDAPVTNPVTNNPVAKPILDSLAGNNTPTQTEEYLLQEINTLRKSGHSCQGKFYPASTKLEWSIALAGAAKTHVKDVLDMYAQGTINVRTQAPPHIGSDGHRVDTRVENQNYSFRTIAENLASGSNASPNTDKVLTSWLASTKGHCEVLIGEDFEDVGLYFENGVWAAVFGDPR